MEDDEDFSQALKLERNGFAIVRAFDGKQGLEEALRRRPSAILLDYHLPQGKGDQVLSRLKMNPKTRSIPVIVLTGVRDQNLEGKMLGLGAERFLTKPLDMAQLLEALHALVDEPVVS